GGDPLVGILNSNEGDVAPVWSVGNADEAVHLGRALADRTWKAGALPDAGASRYRESVALDSRYLESELPGAALSPSPQSPKLCSRAELGAAAGHGATDHPSSIDAVLGGGNDLDLARADCQAPKRRMMGPLQDFLVGTSPQSFPTHAPVALVRLDDTWL